MGIFRNRAIIAFLAVQIIVLNGCLKTGDNGGTAPPAEKRELVTLGQGWNNDERLDFYNTSQGSQLFRIPGFSRWNKSTAKRCSALTIISGDWDTSRNNRSRVVIRMACPSASSRTTI